MKILTLTMTLTLMTTAALAGTCPSSLSFSANGIESLASNKLSAKLTITESSYGKCLYRGTDQDGAYVSASINRGTRRGQTSKGTLYVNFENLCLKTITNLKTVSASKVSTDYSSYRGVKKVTPTTVYSTESNKVVAITKRHSVRAN